MPIYLYGPNAALDVETGLLLGNTVGKVYAPSDVMYTAPLQIIDLNGIPGVEVGVYNGVTTPFRVDGFPAVVWVDSNSGTPVALDAYGGNLPPGGEEGEVLTKTGTQDYESEWRSISEYTTVDTWETIRVVAMADGTIKGIPVWADPPAGPAKPGAVPGSTLVWVSWTPVANASTYKLFRDGIDIYRGPALAYVDRDVQIGRPYDYMVIAYDQFGQRSPESPVAVAAADSSLNVAPVVTVNTWPSPLPSTGRGIIRVCASDAEGQELSYFLAVTGGTVTATRDPSVWIYQA